ncbi:histidine--tRNA ligase [Hydrogenimonas thermophila]|uniref:histidine--tRNA ligase n=1 Tax=Hydrogenimonas thermophila TaxID=223786 RepID=UPI002937403F|nr:histidine--tRNA ligase [Hydrogenimonas thermophila]WOE68823.1 histidine--tRNA ligase [Hydrogenimonas thermophila]WOE71333.1 histidine--tRNA ligase [Hydrogenimonas thermophila]
MIQALRGMKDILSPDNERFEFIIETASRIAKRYGYQYIETPLLEETALFKRSVGESSDIVGKEMYQFIDKGGHDVCLRPEGTAGVVRAFIQNKLDKKGGINRFFYYGPMFRYERPQKGRLREFHQFGCESFGETSVYEDFTIILMIKDIFDALGIGYRIKINSLGCPECMPGYRENLIKHLQDIQDGLCEDCQRRIETNPIRVLDCKVEACQNLLKESPVIVENLCEECDSDFNKLIEMLKSHNLPFELDSKLVRGLDYYTRTAFEFVSDEIGAQSAIAGGGRYNRLVEFLDGKPTPAVGFALGIERIIELVKMPEAKRDGLYLGIMEPEAINTILKLAHIQRQNQKVYTEYNKKSLKAHLKAADRLGVKKCAIIGEDELKAGEIWVKDLETKEEKRIAINQFN